MPINPGDLPNQWASSRDESPPVLHLLQREAQARPHGEDALLDGAFWDFGRGRRLRVGRSH